MNDFKVGDLIKGLKSNGYPFTDGNMYCAEVVELLDKSNMLIKVLKHVDNSLVHGEYHVANSTMFFRLIEKHKSYWKDAAALFGLALGEEFSFGSYKGIYQFIDNGLVCIGAIIPLGILDDMITHPEEVKKMPFHPKYGDVYWYLDSYGSASKVKWINGIFDLSCRAIGNCFKSEEDALALEKEVLQAYGLDRWPK